MIAPCFCIKIDRENVYKGFKCTLPPHCGTSLRQVVHWNLYFCVGLKSNPCFPFHSSWTMWQTTLSSESTLSSVNLLFALLFATTCILLFLFARLFSSHYQKWRLYQEMPSVPTSFFLGSVLGHVEYFFQGSKDLDITACKYPTLRTFLFAWFLLALLFGFNLSSRF